MAFAFVFCCRFFITATTRRSRCGSRIVTAIVPRCITNDAICINIATPIGGVNVVASKMMQNGHWSAAVAGIYAAKMQQPGPDDEHRLSIRVTTDLKERFEKVCLEKKISQQAAIVALMAWFVEQPELLQTLVLGHIKGKHEVRAVAEQALRIYVDGNAILATNFDQVLDERDKKRAAKQRAKPPARRD